MTNQEALDITHREHFTVPEWLERESCITTIRQFDKSRLLAEQALTKIRDKKLFRPYNTLKEFCQRTFGWSDRRTQQVLAAEKVIASLPDKKRTIVRTESQARELSQVPEEQRVEVLKEAKQHGEITAKSIKSAAKSVQNGNGATVEVDSGGIVVPTTALPFWSRKSEVTDLINQIHAIKRKVEAIPKDDPLYANAGLSGVAADLKSAVGRLTGAIPAHVCPYCNGVKEKCRECHSTGVMSEYVWKHAVPKEMKPEQPF
jgi:hypothetical protein